MKTRIAFAAVLAIGCFGAARAATQESPQTGVIKADKFEQIADHVFKATGNVELTVGDVTVRADSVELQSAGQSDDVVASFVAEGNVVLTRGHERLTVERLQFNPQAGTGTFQLQQSKK